MSGRRVTASRLRLRPGAWAARARVCFSSPFLFRRPKSSDVLARLDETSMPEEPEREVALLLAKHRDGLARLRELVGPLLTRPEQDDIFLLRYLLSFDVDAAADAIRWAVVWRAEPQNAYWLARAEEKEASLMKLNLNSEKKPTGAINISAYHKGLRDGGPLQVTRCCSCFVSPQVTDCASGTGGLWADAGHARSRAHGQVLFGVSFFLSFSHFALQEVAFRMCDRRTRETGRLVKLVVINDFTAMRMRCERVCFFLFVC